VAPTQDKAFKALEVVETAPVVVAEVAPIKATQDKSVRSLVAAQVAPVVPQLVPTSTALAADCSGLLKMVREVGPSITVV